MIYKVSTGPFSNKAFDFIEGARGTWKRGQPRGFCQSVDKAELSNIQFILDYLANKSWPRLLLKKKELSKRGAQIDHLHPLTFLIGIFKYGNKHLLYKLKKRGGIPCKEFLRGCVESFHDEMKRGNLTTDQLRVFAQLLSKDVEQVLHFARCHDWKGLVCWL